MKNTDEILEQFFHERNSSKNTIINYTRIVGIYETFTGKCLNDLLELADDEEYNNIRWKNTDTRRYILSYRDFLFNKYNVSTAQLYLTAILTIYRHFEITIPPLPYYSTKHAKKSEPLRYDQLLDRDILRECIEISSPVAKSIILFMSSSGVSRIDVLNLTIGDYLKATSDYHNQDQSVKYAIREMRDTEEPIIPTFNLTRQKTGQKYFTFCSHEAVKTINNYLLTRTEILKKDLPLFKVHERYFNMIFEKLNGHFGLGKVGNWNRIRSHMLRKYHASQLAEAGMSTDHINLLQGRKIPGIAHETYIRIKPETLREEYIQALPYLVISDETRVKTELETVKNENNILKDNMDEIMNRLDHLESLSWDDIKNEY
ncbi:MAG: site-specific integrase [Methanobrevibacter sp.]|nr:site-specific integrase [Methanobrevibacter sp.]